MEPVPSNPVRISGIDLLRLILSYCVVVIHVLFYGGFRTHGDLSNPAFYILWFLGIAIAGTVNCFAMISGYVLYGRRLKYTSVIRLLLAVLYHGLCITAGFRIFLPEAVSAETWAQALMPVSRYEFWYFTAYFGVFFLSPILIRGMEALSFRDATSLVITLVLVFSLIPTATGLDPFGLSLGYSTLWLLIMFVIGTYLRKFGHRLPLSRPVLLGIFAGCVLISCLGMLISVLYPSINGMLLVEYTSPTLVVAAAAAVMLFSSLRVPAPVQKFSRFCGPFLFSIYLLHEHPLVRANLIQDRFLAVMSLPLVLQLLAVPAIALGIWLVCFALDWVRQQLFRLLGVEKLLGALETRFQAWSSPETD